MEKQQEQKFYKFPKTPHLAGSSTVDDDQILSKAEVRAFASNSHVVIQEKIDGNFMMVRRFRSAHLRCYLSYLLIRKEIINYLLFKEQMLGCILKKSGSQ